MTSLETALGDAPRAELMTGPTPIERLHRIEDALGAAARGVRLFAKRDDLVGLGGGGNKVRKLEFLIGDAKRSGADTFITVGGRQSNHARLTAAAAARSGLRCELVLAQLVPRADDDYQHGGNVLLDRLFGAMIHDLPGSADALAFANARAASLRADGRSAYVAPAGGSSPVGCLGYAMCARELLDQSRAMGVRFDRIVVANGSSGTHAGLAAGLAACGEPPSLVRSFSVLASESESRAATLALARETLRLLGAHVALEAADIDVVGSERGAGYGIPTQSMWEAVRMMAAHEGLLLDPVYTGKAFAGLIAGIRAGAYAPGQNVLFVMTGGTTALFAYRRQLTEATDP